VTDLWTDYNDQYTMIMAYPDARAQPEHLAAAETVSDVVRLTEQFVAIYPGRFQPWQALIEQIRHDRLRAVIWGGGSKGVTFLNTLVIIDDITCAVDINPHKQGTFIAGSGQEIVAPDFLRTYRPDLPGRDWPRTSPDGRVGTTCYCISDVDIMDVACLICID
jgi:hypothetical protein